MSREQLVKDVLSKLIPFVESGQVKIVFRDHISGLHNDFELDADESKLILEIFAAKYGIISDNVN